MLKELESMNLDEIDTILRNNNLKKGNNQLKKYQTFKIGLKMI